MTLQARILKFMASPPGGAEPFDTLALETFRHQWAENSAYRRLLEARGLNVPEVLAWPAIPAVSTVAFKRLRLACGPSRLVFRTSGTTSVGALRGEHHLTNTALYEAALRLQFRRFVLPELERLRFISLTPSPDWLPDSSLGFMMADLHRVFGTVDSGFFLGPQGVDFPGVVAALSAAERGPDPVCLAGVASAFVHLLDFLAEAGRQFRLPPGSRLMDTGGFKGRSRSLDRAALLDGYAVRFGISSGQVVNEYGMTELGSQFYDTSLSGGDPEIKVGPHWVRTLVIDPETGRPAVDGQPGLLRHYDLANMDSVLAVETEDLGYRKGEGFVLIGRASGAEPRGCSLLAEGGPRG